MSHTQYLFRFHRSLNLVLSNMLREMNLWETSKWKLWALHDARLKPCDWSHAVDAFVHFSRADMLISLLLPKPHTSMSQNHKHCILPFVFTVVLHCSCSYVTVGAKNLNTSFWKMYLSWKVLYTDQPQHLKHWRVNNILSATHLK